MYEKKNVLTRWLSCSVDYMYFQMKKTNTFLTKQTKTHLEMNNDLNIDLIETKHPLPW